MTIFESLRADHDHQRQIMEALLKTQSDSKTRKTLFSELKQTMANHADAEERYFYNPLIEVDVTQKHARHSIAEHHELDQLIADLESTEMTSPSWLNKCKTLKHELFHHLAEEEKEIFPLAGKVLNENEKTELASEYQNLMDHREKS